MTFQKYFLTALLGLCATAVNAEEFIISYWCGPPATTNINRDYAEVAKCGFNYAMFPCSGATIEANHAILDACKKNKLKYLVYDARLAQFPPGHPAFVTNMEAVITNYIKHPALGGYVLADEPAPDAFQNLAGANQYLLKRDPKRLPFINLYPNYVPGWAIGGSYEQYVEKFLTNVRPRLLSYDHYALLDNDTLRPIYFENLEIIRRQGLKHDVPIGFIFQLTPHGSYRDPSEDELRWQANTALIYGARALMYFTYWHPPADPIFAKSVAVVDASGNRTRHFEEVKRVNAAINAWAPALMKLRSTGVFHTGELPHATIALPENSVVQINGTGAFVIGTFMHEDGSEWVMIMNRDLKNSANATLRFGQDIRRVRELSANKGKLSSVELRDHQLPVQFPVGGAKLFRLSR